MSLSTRIFLGLFTGIAAGLFFGELVADLKIIGEIFIKLLQMTVLPYILVSLIAGFGQQTASGHRDNSRRKCQEIIGKVSLAVQPTPVVELYGRLIKQACGRFGVRNR